MFEYIREEKCVVGVFSFFLRFFWYIMIVTIVVVVTNGCAAIITVTLIVYKLMDYTKTIIYIDIIKK